MDSEHNHQAEEWERLYEQVRKVLAGYGTENAFGDGDYLVVDDNYGWKRINVEIHSLKMLAADVVNRLRSTLSDMSDWEIVVAVDIPGQEDVWPVMGLTIRKNEVIDGLQRQYFPKEFQNLTYADSRIGTGYD